MVEGRSSSDVQMKRNIGRFSQGTYDLLIIGGGINGAATAHLAALNGLKVALLEKDDFASGTSSKSTKLIHGGLRYLENFEFDLVREALHERFILLKSAPHLVRPLNFIIPVYLKDKRPLWMMKLGVWLYDALSGRCRINKHQALTVEDIVKFIPGIKQKDLLGGVMYMDAQMDDARLCLENVLSADASGAHVANYVEVRNLIKENGKAVGVEAWDALGKQSFKIRARKIVCAVGPWMNLFLDKEKSQSPRRVRTTKGIHIVYRGKISEHALLIPTQRDDRIFFVIPWMGNSLIGTTDTDFQGNPDQVGIDEPDVEYLFTGIKRVLPDFKAAQEDMITTFAGLRPLVHEPGAPSKVSRRHVIEESFSGIIYVMGGKYTTFRRIAEDVVRRAVKGTLVDTRNNFSLYGSGVIGEEAEEVAQQYNVNPQIVLYLRDLYGVKYEDVLRLVDKNADLSQPLCACSPAIRAQVQYAVDTEMAIKAEDIIWRRLPLAYTGCPTQECREETARILKANGL